LLFLDPVTGTLAPIGSVIGPLFVAVLGVTAFAAGLAGFLAERLTGPPRVLMFLSAALLLAPGPSVSVLGLDIPVLDAAGFVLFLVVAVPNLAAARRLPPPARAVETRADRAGA
jgi:TRAP-type uncharacterized transport system fused permease subunit